MVSYNRGHFFWEKRGGECTRTQPPQQPGFHRWTQNMLIMILHIDLDLKHVDRLGRNYPWPRPKHCRCGSSRLWGHGFVWMFFDGFSMALEIRRYRCPLCGCVIRLRPEGYFKRHHTDTSTIRRTMVQRIGTGHWPADWAANRGRHWLLALKRNTIAVLGMLDRGLWPADGAGPGAGLPNGLIWGPIGFFATPPKCARDNRKIFVYGNGVKPWFLIKINWHKPMMLVLVQYGQTVTHRI